MIWNPSEGITIAGFTLRFYSLMFVIAFALGYYIMKKVYERENRSQDELDKLFFYTFIATLLGARLGHVFFYDWDNYYKDHLSEILLPFRFSPEFEFTGFSGLASHGAIAIILVNIYYNKNILKKPLLWIFRPMWFWAITIGGVFVRFGNFFNSEIYGHIVNKSFPFGVKFIREDEFWQKNNLFNITQTANSKQAYQLIETDPRFLLRY